MPWADGSDASIRPSFTFESDRSLGWYRSAASTVALSYGTVTASTLSVNVGYTASVLTVGGSLMLAAAASKIVPGATSVSIRNNGDFADNLLVSDAGVVTSRDNVVVGNSLRFNQTVGKIVPGATSIAFRNNADSTNNLLINDIGTMTFRDTATFLNNLVLGTLGGMLQIKNGTNASFGTATLSVGSVNVANTLIAAGDVVFLTDQTAGGTLGDIELGGIRAGSGFTILSTSATDTSTVAWMIVRAAP